MSSIEVLNNHDVIGLDMDDTLMYGYRSHILQDWILKNYPLKELWVVTFRTGVYVNTVFDELKGVGLKSHMFKGIKSVPSQLYFKHKEAANAYIIKNQNLKKYYRFLEYKNYTEKDLEKNYNDYLEWKGLACKEIGATILLDDLPDKVLPGCDKYNIDFINSLQLQW